MSIFKTEAVVLKSQRQGETSKILTLYTRNNGLVKMIAKGSRNIKSRYWGTLELFNHIDIVYYYKVARDLQLLSQASIITTFKNIRGSLTKMTQAATISELFALEEGHESGNPVMFKFLLDFLEALEQAQTGSRNVLRCGELKFLELAGFAPVFQHCFNCGTCELVQDYFFIFASGGYLCHNCSTGAQAGIYLTADAIKLLRWLQSTPIDRVKSLPVPQPVGQQVDQFLHGFLAFHLENVGQLKSLKFLNKTRHGLEQSTE